MIIIIKKKERAAEVLPHLAAVFVMISWRCMNFPISPYCFAFFGFPFYFLFLFVCFSIDIYISISLVPAVLYREQIREMIKNL
jgi:hypothetical protein